MKPKCSGPPRALSRPGDPLFLHERAITGGMHYPLAPTKPIASGVIKLPAQSLSLTGSTVVAAQEPKQGRLM